MPEYDKHAVKAAVKVSTVIGDLVGEPPVRRGRELLVCCPFHDDRHPSLRINDEKNGGVWHCDPCGMGGDAFRFAMEHQGLAFADAVNFLGERYQVERSRT